jgi:hypothetical protein
MQSLLLPALWLWLKLWVVLWLRLQLLLAS